MIFLTFDNKEISIAAISIIEIIEGEGDNKKAFIKITLNNNIELVDEFSARTPLTYFQDIPAKAIARVRLSEIMRKLKTVQP